MHVCDSGCRDGQTPREKSYPTLDEIREDLALLRRNWKMLRLCDCSLHAERVPDPGEVVRLGARAGAQNHLEGQPVFGKPIVIGEAGWCTDSIGRGMHAEPAIPELQPLYCPDLMDWTREASLLCDRRSKRGMQALHPEPERRASP